MNHSSSAQSHGRIPQITARLSQEFIACRGELRRLATYLVESRDLVDDVLQDAYLRLIRSRHAEVSSPTAYCRQVVRNTALDYGRRRAMELKRFVSPADGEPPEVEGGLPAYAGIDQRRAIARVDSMLETVPSRARWAFEHSRLHGLTQREIAKTLGVSATLVNFMVKEVLQVLKPCREDLGD